MAHRYVVRVGKATPKKGWGWKYFYCQNREEIRDVQRNAATGSVIEIYKSEHSFKSAWSKGALS